MVSIADILFYALIGFVVLWTMLILYYIRKVCKFAKSTAKRRPLTQQEIDARHGRH